jgi:type I restriction-modification system DNA methylase subunit
MDTEELGGVYESLLESEPRISADVTFHRFELVGSGLRKQTGSYYTPSSLVAELIKSALDPVIANRLKNTRTYDERRKALLSITVCDPAAGSGHFLLAAARRIASELARIEADGNQPSPKQLREALRQVVRHCLYGVDINTLAVDLCKLGLWLEGHDPGRPLTFLDHHIKVGDSLIGANWDLVAEGIPNGAFDAVTGDDSNLTKTIKKQNREEQKGQLRWEIC